LTTFLNWQISKINQMSKTSNKDIMNEILTAIHECNEISKIPGANSLSEVLKNQNLIMLDKCLNIIETQLMSQSPNLKKIEEWLELLRPIINFGDSERQIKELKLENCYKSVAYIQKYFEESFNETTPTRKHAKEIINALPRFLLQKVNQNIWQRFFTLPGTRLRNQLMEHASRHVEIIAEINKGLVESTPESLNEAIHKLNELNLEKISELKKPRFLGLFWGTANQQIDTWLKILTHQKITLCNQLSVPLLQQPLEVTKLGDLSDATSELMKQMKAVKATMESITPLDFPNKANLLTTVDKQLDSLQEKTGKIVSSTYGRFRKRTEATTSNNQQDQQQVSTQQSSATSSDSTDQFLDAHDHMYGKIETKFNIPDDSEESCLKI
jgi:hypothetical protein